MAQMRRNNKYNWMLEATSVSNIGYKVKKEL